MGKAWTPIAGWAAVVASIVSPARALSAADTRPAADVFYAALHGEPEMADAGLLVSSPGSFVGRAVRTRGRLIAVDAEALRFDLALGATRARLQLEPEAKAVLVARASLWSGHPVEVDGLFYRDEGGPGGSAFALRAWRVAPVEAALRAADAPASEVPLVRLEDLVYAAGKYDGKLVRVRGAYRGPNRERDLPETSRRGKRDWVVKDGYFAAWVTGQEARGERWDLTRRSSQDADAIVEVLGVPATAGGVVRLAARRVDLSLEPGDAAAGVALATPRASGIDAVPPRVSFAYPVPGETLRRHARMILQFNKPLEPRSLESRVRVRYERAGSAPVSARVQSLYRERNRALVLTPEPPPPPGADVIVELLEGIIDVDGRALTAHHAADAVSAEAGVVDRIYFRSGS